MASIISECDDMKRSRNVRSGNEEEDVQKGPKVVAVVREKKDTFSRKKKKRNEENINIHIYKFLKKKALTLK